MERDKDNFRLSGPTHLTHLDWLNPHHQRSVAASLVNGVYVLENDRQKDGEGACALARPWWQSFGFKLHETLIDDADHSIFGAIYHPTRTAQMHPSMPKAVIAFRGTIMEPDSLLRDCELNLALLTNELHPTSCSRIAMRAVEGLAGTYGDHFWLCGHSLGSAVAMLAGKNMAKKGIHIDAFLFNPPFASIPIEPILKGIFDANSSVLAMVGLGLSMFMKAWSGNAEPPDESFAALCKWAPSLFVNPEDLICSGYLDFFKKIEFMNELGVGEAGWLMAQHSIMDLFMQEGSSQPVHAIPTANLITNLRPPSNFTEAHGLSQWWRVDLDLQTKLVMYG